MLNPLSLTRDRQLIDPCSWTARMTQSSLGPIQRSTGRCHQLLWRHSMFRAARHSYGTCDHAQRLALMHDGQFPHFFDCNRLARVQDPSRPRWAGSRQTLRLQSHKQKSWARTFFGRNAAASRSTASPASWPQGSLKLKLNFLKWSRSSIRIPIDCPTLGLTTLQLAPVRKPGQGIANRLCAERFAQPEVGDRQSHLSGKHRLE